MKGLDLTGRVAVVTGASRGIGQAIAASLHELGATVVLTARTEEAATAAAAEVGERAHGIGAHVADEEQAQACIAQVMERFGRLDILVNNAGTNPAPGPVIAQDRSRFMKTMEVNLWAPVLWTGLAHRAWMGEHGGVVINTASIGGLHVSDMIGTYNVSKAALIHATRQMAMELGPKVRVNAIAPGVVRTKLAEALWKEHEAEVSAATPLGRIGEPEDVGSVVAFLASDAASWVTGEVFVIDGGQLLRGGG
ncbi:MAG: SDR family oxidoreductase [Micrococcales bacterium]|nr:SDR family oxidoreductase [Micrococcales bacterium]